MFKDGKDKGFREEIWYLIFVFNDGEDKGLREEVWYFEDFNNELVSLMFRYKFNRTMVV